MKAKDAKALIDAWEHGCGFNWSITRKRSELVLLIEEYAEQKVMEARTEEAAKHDTYRDVF